MAADEKLHTTLPTFIGVKVMMLNNGKLYLCKREQVSGIQNGKWDLVGGKMQLNEDLQIAVTREVLQDCGWKVGNIRLFKINIYSAPEEPDGQHIEVLFVVDAVMQVRTTSGKPNEQRWFLLTDLPESSDLNPEHAESIYALAKLIHGGKTLELNRLPPVFSLKKSKKIASLLSPPVYNS